MRTPIASAYSSASTASEVSPVKSPQSSTAMNLHSGGRAGFRIQRGTPRSFDTQLIASTRSILRNRALRFT